MFITLFILLIPVWLIPGILFVTSFLFRALAGSLSKIPKHYQTKPVSEFLEFLVYKLSQAADLFARTVHGWEVVGLENIPTDKPAILVFYHGIIPVDMYYLPNRIYLQSGRVVRTVMHWIFFGPWLWPWARATSDYLFPGPVEKCTQVLKRGHLLGIAVGGSLELFFSTSNYEVVWGNRDGFARAALEANAEIVPIFTRNIRQLSWLPESAQWLMWPLYLVTRFPLAPILPCAFPVKLVTHVCEPIPAGSCATAEELVEVSKKALEELIAKHQVIPGTVANGLKERFL